MVLFTEEDGPMTEGPLPGGSKLTAGDQGEMQAVSESDRRRFLELCSKFAVGMPPAISLLVSSSESLAGHDEACPDPAPQCPGSPGL